MAEEANRGEVRRSILELSPLELECMKVLWRQGEASVREVQEALFASVPRAYTTIMTILDRLAQKGVVSRQKAGKAWAYRPNLSAEEARSHAVAQVLVGFFEGSAEALAAHLATPGSAMEARRTRRVFAEAEVVPSSLLVDELDEPRSEPVRERPAVRELDTTLL